MSLTEYPDLSEFQGGVSVAGAPFVMARATEGDWFTDPDYEGYRRQAAGLSIPFAAYHFLESYSTASAQARWARNVAGDVPLMIDVEPIAPGDDLDAESGAVPLHGGIVKPLDLGDSGSYPTAALALEFAAEYRALGGTCHMCYLPKWYWEDLGSPPLQGFIDAGFILVSSDYTTYSGNGPGWAPYVWDGGQWDPSVWQFSETTYWHGVTTDFNAYRGSAAGLWSLARTGHMPGHAPAPPLEDDMLLIQPTTGSPVPLTWPDGTKRLRFFSNRAVTLRVNFPGSSRPDVVLVLGDDQGAQGAELDSELSAVVYGDTTAPIAYSPSA